MARVVASVRLEGGKITVRNRRQFDEALAQLQDCNGTLTFERSHATRSKAQNDYYYAVVVPRIQTKFKSLGLMAGRDTEATHEALKAQFMDPALVESGAIRGFISDSGLTLGTSTSDLNKLEFIEYLERIVMHAAAHWDCYIPDPDPQWREKAEAELSQEAKRRVRDVLGDEPREAENYRERGDDDGQEYGHPGDRLRGVE